MAEEESFTFVDKRRTQADADAEEPAAAESPAAQEDAGAAGLDDIYAEENTETSTDVYGMISYCISLLSAEAWQKLGLIADSQTGEVKPDLVQAKLAIDSVNDLAARLESAPTEVIPEKFRRDLRTLLNDLRLNYVAQRDHAVDAVKAS